MACLKIRRGKGEKKPQDPLAAESDRELISGILADVQYEARSSELFHRYWQYALRVALRWTRNSADAEDMAQQSLEDAFKHLARFQASRARFSTWLYAIVWHNCHTLHRHLEAEHRCLAELERAGEPRTPDVARQYMHKVMEHEAWQELALLRPRERAAFALHRLERKSMAETGRLLGMSERQVRYCCFLATQALARRAEEAERRFELTG